MQRDRHTRGGRCTNVFRLSTPNDETALPLSLFPLLSSITLPRPIQQQNNRQQPWAGVARWFPKPRNTIAFSLPQNNTNNSGGNSPAGEGAVMAEARSVAAAAALSSPAQGRPLQDYGGIVSGTANGGSGAKEGADQVISKFFAKESSQGLPHRSHPLVWRREC